MLGNDRRTPSHRTTIPHGRAAVFLARAILRRRGYTVIRSVGSDSLVHLTAWGDRDRPVFVRVKRSRKPVAGAADVVARWPEEIAELRTFPRANGGSVQFWIYCGQRGWKVYEVLPGGIAEVRE